MRAKDNIHTAAGKREFIKTFLNSVRDELTAKAASMPPEWDGHELRWLVADKFTFEQHHRAGHDRWPGRINAYNKERLGRNL